MPKPRLTEFEGRKFSRHASAVVGIAVLMIALVFAGLLVNPSRAYAALLPVELGTAGSYSVLGATGIVSTGNTVVHADLGVSPSSSISGFPPGVIDGATHAGDPQAAQAQSDLISAYNVAAGLTPSSTFSGDQNGQTFIAGTYYTAAAFALTGTMTLDGQGNPNVVFIFQVNAALNTAAASTIKLTNRAQASNVFWQVNGAAGTGALSSFTGTIMAAGAITVGAGSSIDGRALSYGTVTLADDIITTPDIVTFASPPTPTSALTTNTADTVLATGTPGDSGAMTYTSNTPSICSVDSSSRALTYVTFGACVIGATQAADNSNGFVLTTTTTSITVSVPPAFTVTFNGNGSTGGSSAIETANMPTALTPNGFSRTGYAFSGWNTQASGGGTAYGDGATYPFTAAVTLYAQWTRALVILIQASPTSATIAVGDGYSGQGVVTNASGTVTYTETSSPDSTNVVVTSTGAMSATTALAAGTYLVSGDESDLSGDRGTWRFALTVTALANTVGTGYDLVESGGGVFVFGAAPFLGSLPGIGVNVKDVVGIVSTSDGGGYWLVASDGGIFSFGDANFYGSTGAIHLNRPIVGIAATPDGKGYWLVASDGGIFSFGDAAFYGSTGAIHLNKAIVGMAATPDGGGYWLVASDGGIFTFGDAAFYGSTGAIHLNKPIVGMTLTPSGHGYWLVAADGGIFTFGDAPFFGSTGNIRLNSPIVGMTPTPDGRGYWFTASDGGVFSYGDAPFFGSLGGRGVDDVVGMAR